MAIISTTTTDSDGNIIYDINVSTGDSLVLPTGGTYVENNIVLNINADTSTTGDATASSSDILSGKTAYAHDVKLVGILSPQNFYTDSTDPENTLGNNFDLYYKSAT